MTTQSSASPDVFAHFDPHSHTVSYVVSDPYTKHALIIDSVLDYDDTSLEYRGTESADILLAHIREVGLQVDMILETHVHADHVSAGPYLTGILGAPLAISERVKDIHAWVEAVHGTHFDRYLLDNEQFMLGGISVRVIPTPGHTPSDVSYLVGDAVFCGDTLFMPDYGTARVDFPGASASAMHHSVARLYELPDSTRVFVGHDYLPPGRSIYQYETTIGAQKEHNVHLGASTTLLQFANFREAKDKTLGTPKLMHVAIPLNLAGGGQGKPD
jgi:glyoxylase-like metal-dependent hydrolase (beta-lactamase superfamily II)